VDKAELWNEVKDDDITLMQLSTEPNFMLNHALVKLLRHALPNENLLKWLHLKM
jgi:hypothetical protein